MSTTCQSELHQEVADDFLFDVIQGLRGWPKTLPSKYFYDEAGSQLFDQITTLPEYYPTRTERGILERYVGELARIIGPFCRLVEYGSGTSEKTRILLDHLDEPVSYVPIDVADEHLQESAHQLALEYPQLDIQPLCADFMHPISLPKPRRQPTRTVVFFPGSTIGNLFPDDAMLLLKHTAELCGPGGMMVLGADLRKNVQVLEAAYNDTQGVTAAFNLNMLVRINRELGGNFDVKQFLHYAFFNQSESRIEMHLVSLRDQRVQIAGEEFHFAVGESIHTENSYKYGLQELRDMAYSAGFEQRRVWTDAKQYFSVQVLEVN